MVQANDSVTVTPGSGATIATHLANSKEHQVFMQANADGHILGSIPTYTAWSTSLTASANLVYWHLFNASGSGKVVKVRKIFVQPSMVSTALAGQTWRVAKTSAVGTTGNTAITPRANDSNDAALPAQITVARSYTAGGTQTFTYFEIALDPEETRPAVGITPYFNILPTDGEFVSDIVLREGEGMAVQNVTGGSYAWSVLGVFTVI
jgi:hypothetical protein